jgi:tetratricopeptide (TPR) repeat protein
MRRLIIAALSALILLCTPILTPQGRGLHSSCWPTLMINLLWIGAPAATSPRLGAPPAQAPSSERGAAPSAQESISLEPGKPVERELSGGRSHFYKVSMTSGQYLQIAISQRGIDVLVALYTPDGKKIDDADVDKSTEGGETISAIAEAAGAYMVEARSAVKTAQTGRYEIKVEELRAATAEDKYRVAGETVFREAERLGNGTLEAKRKSIEKYQEALDLHRRAGARDWEAVTLNSIGMIYNSLGETQKALEKFNEGLPLWRAVGDRNGEALALNNIGGVYRSLGEMQKALEKLNETLPILRAVGDRSLEAVTLNNIGGVYQSLGETQKALEKFNESLLLRRRMGDRNGEARTLDNIGLVYRSLGEMQKALEKFNEALPISRAVGDRRVEGVTLNSIGLVYQSLGETQKALEKFNEALPIFQFISDRNGEAAALMRIAQVEQQRGNLTQARQTIEQAVGMIESLRTNIAGHELRASYFASRQEFYQSYIDVLMRMQMQNPTAAFDSLALEVSERARARSLLELLTESRADLRQGVDGSLLERERSLQQLLNAKAAVQFALLNRKHTPEQAESFAKEISSLSTEYEELRGQIRARSPRYAALTQPQPLGMAEIQQQVLDPDTLLLEYSLGDNASHLFVVSQTSITSHQLPKRAEIEAATRRVRELLTAPQPQPGDTEAKYQARVKKAR